MSYATWMADLPERLTKVPLGHLAIPGSHNSFSCSIRVDDGVAVDQNQTIQRLGKLHLGRRLIHRWSVNQNIGMVGQLSAGIRYFDLRVCKKPDSGRFHFLHGLYGDDVKHSLTEMKPFFQENPKEVAILDMNHSYNMEHSDHVKLLGEIVDTLQELLIPESEYKTQLSNLTLANLWNNAGRIIIIYLKPDQTSFLRIWNWDIIRSPWPNTPSKDELINFLECHYVEGRRQPGHNFHVWQGCLTPGTGTIVKHLFGSLQSSLAGHATKAFVDWVKNKEPGDCKINICIVDFVEQSDYIRTIIELNMKLTVD